MIAIRRGHMFKIRIGDSSDARLYERFMAAFERILADSEDHRTSLATLTADERSSWAQVNCWLGKKPSGANFCQIRHDLMASELNRAAITEIETAAFIVCLDDARPINPSE